MAPEQLHPSIEEFDQLKGQVSRLVGELGRIQQRVSVLETQVIRGDIKGHVYEISGIDEYPDLKFDSRRGQFVSKKKEQPICSLSKRQSRLMDRVLWAKGDLASYQELTVVCYPEDKSEVGGYGDKVRLEGLIQRTRRKMKKISPQAPKFLQTVPERGLRWAMSVNR